jgi:1-acyl-sn-glycerol-3-phosphate acyltransferase
MFHLIKFILKTFYGLIYRIQIFGLENIPKDEAVIIAPNHIHYADPLIIGAYYPGYLSLMAKKELFNNKLLAKTIGIMGAFPVDRDGNDIKAIKLSLGILKKGQPLLIFPEGTRNMLPGKQHGSGKAGVPLLAYKTKVKIVPVTIDSTYKFLSPVRILYHEPITITWDSDTRISTDDYITIVDDILDGIYSHMELRE